MNPPRPVPIDGNSFTFTKETAMSVDGVYETDADVEHYFYSYTHPTLGRMFQRVPKRGTQFQPWRVTPVRMGDLVGAIFTLYARPTYGGPMVSTMVEADVGGQKVTIGAGYELVRTQSPLWQPYPIPPQHNMHWQDDSEIAN